MPRVWQQEGGKADGRQEGADLIDRHDTPMVGQNTKDGRADLNVNLLIDKELTIKSVFRYRNIYPKAIAAVASGAIPVESVVSAIFPLEEAEKGMNDAINRKADVTKCVIQIAAEES